MSRRVKMAVLACWLLVFAATMEAAFENWESPGLRFIGAFGSAVAFASAAAFLLSIFLRAK